MTLVVPHRLGSFILIYKIHCFGQNYRSSGCWRSFAVALKIEVQTGVLDAIRAYQHVSILDSVGPCIRPPGLISPWSHPFSNLEDIANVDYVTA